MDFHSSLISLSFQCKSGFYCISVFVSSNGRSSSLPEKQPEPGRSCSPVPVPAQPCRAQSSVWGSPTGGGSCLAWPRPGLSVPRVSRAELAVPWVAQRCPPCVPNVSCARGLCCPCTLQGGCCWWPQGLGWLWALWPWWGTSSTFPACPPVLAAPQQV